MTGKIWWVVDGPFTDDDGLIWNVCLIETEGKLEPSEVYFQNFEQAYDMVKYFSRNIEPIELEKFNVSPLSHS